VGSLERLIVLLLGNKRNGLVANRNEVRMEDIRWVMYSLTKERHAKQENVSKKI
jgi:hypothetical protein